MLRGGLRIARAATATMLVGTVLTSVTWSTAPASAAELVEPQTAGMRLLSRAADGDVVANFRNGVPATLFASVDVGTESPEAAAEAFLAANRLLYFQTDPDLDLVVDEVVPGTPLVHMRQTYLGLDLVGPSMTVVTDGTSVLGTIGEILGARGLEQELDVDIVPDVTPEEATAIVEATGATVLGVPRLVLVVPSMFAMDDEVSQLSDDAVLAWEVVTNDPAELVMVDAHTGEVLLRLPREYTDSGFDGFDFELFDSDGSTATDWPPCYGLYNGEHIGDEDGVDHPGNAEDVAAYNAMRQAYGRYHSLLGRHSYDGDGDQIELFLRTPGRAFSTAPNASWSPSCDLIQASPGWAVSDVVYHELTHGVVQYTSGLVYQNQSGALNEHFADVMAVLLEQPSNPDWVIGEDLPGGAIRDIPNINRNRFSELLMTSNDNGGVHSNSAIPNYATYLMVAGGTHPDNGITVVGDGPALIRELEYLTMLTLDTNATLADYANTMVFYAEDFATQGPMAQLWDSWLGSWFQPNDYDAQTACAVRNALRATELLGQGDLDCDGTLDNADPDDDNDGTPDASDNCPGVANWGQNDNDGDGLGDACDPDDDNDGVADVDDNCQFTKNPGQANSDGVGKGDACQDSDGDGVIDTLDGCPNAYNPDQADQDTDGIQDACDPDRDGDGVPNGDDGCPDDHNPGQEDTDGGGIQDACDADPDSPLNDWLEAFANRGIPPETTIMRVKLPDICGGGCPDDIFDPAQRIRFEFEGLADTSVALITDARGIPVSRVQASADQVQAIEFSPATLGQLSLTLFGPGATAPANVGGGQVAASPAGASGASRAAAAAPADSPLDMTAVAPDRFEVTMSMGTDLEALPGASVSRRAGDDRFETATAISAASFDPGGTVFVATGRAFPDALAAGPLARALHAPVLLVEPESVPSAVVAELERLEPTQVVVLGGEGAVSPAVTGRLAEVTGIEPIRLAGLDRYETAADVSAAGWSPGVDTVFVATGLAAPDALAGGALAGTMGAPLLLTHTPSLSEASRAELVRLEPRRVIVLGGAAAVSDEVVAELGELADVVDRLAGLDRYETAAAIAAANPFRTRTAYVATGLDFPDALAAAPAASLVGAPILLSTRDGLPAATVGAVQEVAPDAVIAVGGAGVIRESVLTELRALVE